MKSRVYGYARISTSKQSIERQIRNIKAVCKDAVIVTDECTGTNLDRPGWLKLYRALNAGDRVIFDSVSRMSRDADEGFSIYEELFTKGVELIFLKEPHINTETYKQAIAGQINLTVSTGDGKTDTLIQDIGSAINRYLLALAKEQIRLAFDQSQKEVDDLKQRTKEGIETARLNGAQIGQVKGNVLDVGKTPGIKELIRKYSKDFDGTNSDIEVMAILKTKEVTYTKKRGGKEVTKTVPATVDRNTYYKYKKQMKAEV